MRERGQTNCEDTLSFEYGARCYCNLCTSSSNWNTRPAVGSRSGFPRRRQRLRTFAARTWGCRGRGQKLGKSAYRPGAMITIVKTDGNGPWTTISGSDGIYSTANISPRGVSGYNTSGREIPTLPYPLFRWRQGRTAKTDIAMATSIAAEPTGHLAFACFKGAGSGEPPTCRCECHWQAPHHR